MIEDIITIPLIQLRVKTTDWRDAIKSPDVFWLKMVM